MGKRLLELNPTQRFRKLLDGYFVAFCRKAFHWSPQYKEVRKLAFTKRENSFDWFMCQSCKKEFIRKDTQVDHIKPVVPVDMNKPGSWEWYRDQVFCSIENLRVLCKVCHKSKTLAENKLRYKFKTGCYSPESAYLISLANKGHKYLVGIPKIEAHKRSMSLERKGKPQTLARLASIKKAHEKLKIPIIATCLKTNVELRFSSVKEAGHTLGLQACNISRVINGNKQNRSQVGGYTFKRS